MIVQELSQIQSRHGYLPREALVALADRLAVPLYRISQVLSFFPHYRTTPPPEIEVNVCRDMACHLRGSEKVIADLQTSFAGQERRVKVCGVSCLGRCDRAPAARIYDNRLPPPGDDHHEKEHAHPVYNLLGRGSQEIRAAAEALLAGEPAAAIPNDSDAALPQPSDQWQVNIYAGQKPEQRYQSIRQFIAAGASDPARVNERDRVIEALKTAYLLGMGGAGGRAYKKWSEVREAVGERKYVVCNGDESEPGTFKDRELFLRTPYLVVEGVILAGLLLNASRGYIYIRHEYEEQIAAVRAEIKLAEKLGCCGENILGSGLSFPVEVFVSPGGYICGEQTALIQAIQDERAEPRNRPPELQTNGLWDMPTLLNNVETFAWVPAIVTREQGKWYQQQGEDWNEWTDLVDRVAVETKDRNWREAFGSVRKFKGRRFFSVSGDVERPGAYEVPIGITLAGLIEVCGGMREGQSLKAIALSGPSGGFLPPLIKVEYLSGKIRKYLPAGMQVFDLRQLQLDMSLFRAWGPMMGAGITIYGEAADMVDQALSASLFYARESCGKCVPCRIGSTKIVEMAEDLRAGKLSASDIDQLRKRDGSLQELALTMRNTAICGLGTVAPNPLTTLLAHFDADVQKYLKPA